MKGWDYSWWAPTLVAWISLMCTAMIVNPSSTSDTIIKQKRINRIGHSFSQALNWNWPHCAAVLNMQLQRAAHRASCPSVCGGRTRSNFLSYGSLSDRGSTPAIALVNTIVLWPCRLDCQSATLAWHGRPPQSSLAITTCSGVAETMTPSSCNLTTFSCYLHGICSSQVLDPNAWSECYIISLSVSTGIHSWELVAAGRHSFAARIWFDWGYPVWWILHNGFVILVAF